MNFIEQITEYKHVLDKILENSGYYEAIANNGKFYFDNYCTPKAQAKYIIDSLMNS